MQAYIVALLVVAYVTVVSSDEDQEPEEIRRCMTNKDCFPEECCVKIAEIFLGKCRSLGKKDDKCLPNVINATFHPVRCPCQAEYQCNILRFKNTDVGLHPVLLKCGNKPKPTNVPDGNIGDETGDETGDDETRGDGTAHDATGDDEPPRMVVSADEGQGLSIESRKITRCKTNADCSENECCVNIAAVFLGRCKKLGKGGDRCIQKDRSDDGFHPGRCPCQAELECKTITTKKTDFGIIPVLQKCVSETTTVEPETVSNDEDAAKTATEPNEDISPTEPAEET